MTHCPTWLKRRPGHDRHRNGASPTLPRHEGARVPPAVPARPRRVRPTSRTPSSTATTAARWASTATASSAWPTPCATELGVEPGDRVAVMSTNSHQYLELYHACFLGAAVINPLNLRLAGKELDYIVRDSGTEVVFVDGFFGAAFAAGHGGVRRRPSPLRHVVLIGDRSTRHPPPHDVRLRGPDRRRRARRPRRARGGRPGRPHVHGRHDRPAQGRAARAAGRDAEPVPHRRPWSRSTPTRSTCTRRRCSTPPPWAAILRHPRPRRHVGVHPPVRPRQGAWRLIEEHGVTWTVMVPTMIGMVLNHPDFKPERLASLSS